MKIKIYLFLITQLVVYNVQAQNLSNSLGGIKTNFCLISDTTDLNAIDQIIIKRAENKTYGDFSYGVGRGAGYQSLHLEFTTKEHLNEKKFRYRAGRNNNDKLELTFYNSSNTVLTSFTLDFSVVDLIFDSSSNNDNIFYSIDLIDIPIVLLNKTVKIDLLKKVSDKKK